MNQDRCPDADVFSAFVKGTLERDQYVRVKEHIASCPICADAAEGFVLMGSPLEDVKAELDLKVDQRIERSKNKRGVWFSVAAIGVVFLISGYIFLQMFEKGNEGALSGVLNKATYIEEDKNELNSVGSVVERADDPQHESEDANREPVGSVTSADKKEEGIVSNNFQATFQDEALTGAAVAESKPVESMEKSAERKANSETDQIITANKNEIELSNSQEQFESNRSKEDAKQESLLERSDNNTMDKLMSDSEMPSEKSNSFLQTTSPAQAPASVTRNEALGKKRQASKSASEPIAGVVEEEIATTRASKDDSKSSNMQSHLEDAFRAKNYSKVLQLTNDLRLVSGEEKFKMLWYRASSYAGLNQIPEAKLLLNELVAIPNTFSPQAKELLDKLGQKDQ